MHLNTIDTERMYSGGFQFYKDAVKAWKINQQISDIVGDVFKEHRSSDESGYILKFENDFFSLAFHGIE